MLPRGAVRALRDTPEVETVRLPMRYIRRKGNTRRAGATATDGATAAAAVLLVLACRRRPFVQRRVVKRRGAVVAGAEEEIRVGVRVGIPLLCSHAAAAAATSSTAAELRTKMGGAPPITGRPETAEAAEVLLKSGSGKSPRRWPERSTIGASPWASSAAPP